jgi:thioredoxin-like negative regulator of GroEL
MTKRKEGRRRLGLGVALACWLGTAFAPVLALGPEAIAWRTDVARAEHEARTQKRLLWIQFTGAWCPNCVRLERESFVHPQVVGHARDHFVPVKVDAEKREDLIDRFRLSGIPATVLLNPAGAVVARHEGYLNPAAFHAFLERALIESGRSARPERAIAGQAPPRMPGVPSARTRPPAARLINLLRPNANTVWR